MKQQQIKAIASQNIVLKEISNNDLLEFCLIANKLYRVGSPIISDEDYDFVFLAELKNRNPDSIFLQKVEDENNAFSDNKLKLPYPMLSTDKAFSIDEVKKWLNRIIKSAKIINFSEKNIIIKATPKLDGFAAFDDGKILYTRGDGKKGSDISRVFTRGLQVFANGKRGLGAGEIVVKKSYFDKFLSNNFEHSRNFQASIIREKELDEFGKNAILLGAAVFTPFTLLPQTTYTINELLSSFSEITNNALSSVDFDIDGVIFEVTNLVIKNAMGSNRKFHRWMIALKENKEKAQVEVLSVLPQVGRTGKITPVAKLTPTKLSGALISSASCYHYNFVRKQCLGTGSIIELIRSGLVIPKIVKVLKKTSANIPKICPSCNNKLKWQSDFLICNNHFACPEQIITRLTYFFAILANNDGFGEATVSKLFQHNIRKISEVYTLTVKNFQLFGFGEKTANNLFNELKKSREIRIEDYRFLSAFGIERLGLGNSENLFKKYSINEIFNLTVEEIAKIDGFADITATAIVSGLKNIQIEFKKLFKLGFNLEKTLINTSDINNYFTNKKLVFTGTMSNSRDEMKKLAKYFGAIIQSSVSSKTDFLIIGIKVGQSKLEKAKKLDIKIITEQEYFNFLD